MIQHLFAPPRYGTPRAYDAREHVASGLIEGLALRLADFSRV